MSEQLRRLSKPERGLAAETLAGAFMADPLFVWAVPKDERRLGWLRTFMRSSLWMSWNVAETWRTPDDEGQAPSAVITMLGPERRLSRWREVGFLARLFPGLLIGRPTLRRSPQLLKAFATIDQMHPDEPHWYLIQLGVSSAAQGRGLGRLIVETAIERAESDGTPCYLETSNPANVGFYERFGFEVVERVEVGEVPPIWTMLRAANTVSA